MSTNAHRHINIEWTNYRKLIESILPSIFSSTIFKAHTLSSFRKVCDEKQVYFFRCMDMRIYTWLTLQRMNKNRDIVSKYICIYSLSLFSFALKLNLQITFIWILKLFSIKAINLFFKRHTRRCLYTLLLITQYVDRAYSAIVIHISCLLSCV